MFVDNDEFVQFALDNGVVSFGTRRLSSGRLSNFYFNWRNVSNDVRMIDKLSNFVIKYVIEFSRIGYWERPDEFIGVAEGATKLGVVTQFKWGLNGGGRTGLSMIRGKKKEHGDVSDRDFVGQPSGNVVLLEDITTTGKSLADAVSIVKKLPGVSKVYALGLTDRSGGEASKLLYRSGIPYSSISTDYDLLQEAYDRLQPGDDIAVAVNEEYTSRGLPAPIKL